MQIEQEGSIRELVREFSNRMSLKTGIPLDSRDVRYDSYGAYPWRNGMRLLVNVGSDVFRHDPHRPGMLIALYADIWRESNGRSEQGIWEIDEVIIPIGPENCDRLVLDVTCHRDNYSWLDTDDRWLIVDNEPQGFSFGSFRHEKYSAELNRRRSQLKSMFLDDRHKWLQSYLEYFLPKQWFIW